MPQANLAKQLEAHNKLVYDVFMAWNDASSEMGESDVAYIALTDLTPEARERLAQTDWPRVQIQNSKPDSSSNSSSNSSHSQGQAEYYQLTHKQVKNFKKIIKNFLELNVELVKTQKKIQRSSKPKRSGGIPGYQKLEVYDRQLLDFLVQALPPKLTQPLLFQDKKLKVNISNSGVLRALFRYYLIYQGVPNYYLARINLDQIMKVIQSDPKAGAGTEEPKVKQLIGQFRKLNLDQILSSQTDLTPILQLAQDPHFDRATWIQMVQVLGLSLRHDFFGADLNLREHIGEALNQLEDRSLQLRPEESGKERRPLDVTDWPRDQQDQPYDPSKRVKLIPIEDENGDIHYYRKEDVYSKFDSQNIPQNNLTSLISIFTKPYNDGQNDWSRSERDQLLVQGQLSAPKANSALYNKFRDQARNEVNKQLERAELEKRKEIDPETSKKYLSKKAKALVRAELIAQNRLTIDWKQVEAALGAAIQEDGGQIDSQTQVQIRLDRDVQWIRDSTDQAELIAQQANLVP